MLTSMEISSQKKSWSRRLCLTLISDCFHLICDGEITRIVTRDHKKTEAEFV